MKETKLFLAEMIGTFFLVFMGCGAAILAELNPHVFPSFLVPLVFGGTVVILVYALGHISGAHFNPAVTLAFTAIKGFPKRRMLGYVSFQFMGAIMASLCHYFIWKSEIHHFGVTVISQGIVLSGLFIEILLSFLLMFVIMSMSTDCRAIGDFSGVSIGLVICMCAFVGGPLTGASMNPARTLGPALISLQFSNIWVYFIGPVIGTFLGAWIYGKIKCDSPQKSQFGCC